MTLKLTTSQAASIPEGQNELKRNQLRELAALNGTLRDDENQACQNCGQIGHRKYDCPEKQNYTANIICRVCGNAGHMARDCPDRQRGASWRNDGPMGARPAGRIGGSDNIVDREYEVCDGFLPLFGSNLLTPMKQLMQELGGSGAAPARIEAGPGSYNGGGGSGGDARPWQRGPTGGPAPWRSRNNDRDGDSGGQSGGPAPWARDRGDRDRGNRSDNRDNGDYYASGASYGGIPPAPPGAAPWQQAAPPAPPAYPGGYAAYGAYGAPPGMSGPPPGLPPPPAGAPPGLPGGLNALIQQYANAVPPPPPPSGEAPPPPPMDVPPPPPPGA